MLRVCLVIDVEGFVSLKQIDPVRRDYFFPYFLKKIALNLIKNLRYDGEGFLRIYKLIAKERFSVSFMLVGSLFKPMQHFDFIDWGYHGLSHRPLTFLSDATARREIKNIYSAVSFSPPINLIEDPLKPERLFKMLKREGYKITTYGGAIIRDKRTGKIVILKNPKGRIRKPVRRFGVLCVYISSGFNGSEENKINQILSEIDKNCSKNAVYCIKTHDFDNKDLTNLKKLIKELKRLENEGKIKIVNLKQIKE